MATIPSLGLNTLDTGWIKSSFLLSANSLSTTPFQDYGSFTTTQIAMGDTTLGGSMAINAPVQNCPFADLRYSGLSATAVDSKGGRSFGLGRSYNENILENLNYVTFQFGVLRYKGMFGFFMNFYDQDQASLARQGRSSSLFFTAGQVIGDVAQLVVGLAFLPVVIAGWLGFQFFGRPGSAYYYISPTMGPYWNRATWILNQMMSNMNLIPRNWVSANILDKFTDNEDPVTMNYVQYAHRVAPDIFREEGGIDLYSVGNKYARLDFQRKTDIDDLKTKAGSLGSAMSGVQTLMIKKYKDQGQEDLRTYLQRYFNSPFGSTDYAQTDSIDIALQNGADISTIAAPPEGADPSTSDQATADQANANADANKAAADDSSATAPPKDYRNQWWKSALSGNTDPNAPEYTNTGGFFEKLREDIQTNARQGNQWVTFCANFTGQSTESFSNELRESDISSTMNSTSGSAAEARFSFSGGETGIPGVSAVIGAVTDLFKGALSTVHMDGLMALAGNANVHIPKHYASSSANFQTQTLTMELRSPYGNPLAQALNIYTQVALLIAGAFPISTGTQSYTGPYYCNAYSQGRFHYRNAMITDLTLTRGVGNLGWNKGKRALGIDVSLTITSADVIMHAPIDVGMNPLKPWKLALDDDSAFKDYLSTLASLSLADQEMYTRKLAIQWATRSLQLESFFSESHVASYVSDFKFVQFLGKAEGLISGVDNSRLLGS